MRNVPPLLFLLTLSFYAHSQNCLNASFENGTLEGYTTYFGKIHEDGKVSIDFEGYSRNQHKIMHISDGIDPIAKAFCTINKDLPVVSENGGEYTLRLGNEGAGAQAERVLLKFKVTPDLTFFQLRYAVVLNDPNHESFEQPRFELRILDEFGHELPCGEYTVRAAADIPGFESCKNGWRIRPWTTVGFELKSFLDQNIQIGILTTDCARGKHAGYAYFDATCQPLTIDLEGYCPGKIDATMSVTEGFLKYEWSTGETTSSITLNDPQPRELYQVTVTSATGCTVVLEDTIPTISAFSVPKFSPEADQLFCRDTSFLFTPTGENLGMVYSPTLDTTASAFLLDTKSPNRYTFTTQGRFGCFIDTLQFEVTQKPLTIESSMLDSISCYGEADGVIQVSVGSDFAPIQYQWEHGAVTSFTDGLSEGQYTVTISSNTNCTSTASFNLTNPPPLFLEIVNKQPFSCSENPSGQISIIPAGGSTPYEIAWDNGEQNSRDLTQLSAGIHTVTLTDAKGCTTEESTIIEEVPPPLLTFDVTPVSCFGKEDGALQLSINGRLAPYAVSWQDGLQLQGLSRENLAADEYSAMVTDNLGCTKEAAIVVPTPPLNADCGIYIPTAFSPNGDGVNDVFFVDGYTSRQAIESIHIVDRWGNLVFSNEGNCTTIGDKDCGWDGRMNGQFSPIGVYVYAIKIRVENIPRPLLYKGEIILVGVSEK